MDDEHDDIRGDAVWAQHNVGVGIVDMGLVCVLVLCGEWTFVCVCRVVFLSGDVYGMQR